LLTETLPPAQFETLLTELIAESISSKAIAFLENLDLIGYDKLRDIKLAISRQGFQSICTVAEDFYIQQIEPDGVLRIRFQQITPSTDSTDDNK
jgi:hypothetical protein